MSLKFHIFGLFFIYLITVMYFTIGIGIKNKKDKKPISPIIARIKQLNLEYYPFILVISNSIMAFIIAMVKNKMLIEGIQLVKFDLSILWSKDITFLFIMMIISILSIPAGKLYYNMGQKPFTFIVSVLGTIFVPLAFIILVLLDFIPVSNEIIDIYGVYAKEILSLFGLVILFLEFSLISLCYYIYQKSLFKWK